MQVTRVSELVTFILMAVWVSQLGGLSLSPRQLSATSNDTGQLFNWHPLLVRCSLRGICTAFTWVLSFRMAHSAPVQPLTSASAPAMVMGHAIACRWPSLFQSSWLRLSCPTAPH